MAINGFFGNQYITIRSKDETELDNQIHDLTEVRKTHRLIGKRKWYEEHTGNMWYAKLKRID